MVEGKNDEAATNENSETGCDSLSIVKGVDHLRYIGNTNSEDAHR
jgi:hypothetical protein